MRLPAFTKIHSQLAKPSTLRILTYVLPTLFIILFFYQYAFSGNNLRNGDFDYYAQMYEAFRISVLNYGQFPDWNPWMVGGVPLFANPQFGLASLQSITVLVFGSIYGLKIAYITYAVVGFWGMYFVARHIGRANKPISLAIAFIWIANGFFAGHGISHFTFSLFFLFPWLVYLLHFYHRPRYWLWFGLLVSIIGLSSIHYSFLMMLVACGIFIGFRAVISLASVRKWGELRERLRRWVSFAIKAMLIVCVFLIYRLITTYLYVKGNERIIDSPEIYPTLEILLKAVFLPIGEFIPVPTDLQWGWWEYSMYIGVGAGVACVLAFIAYAPRAREVLRSQRLIVLLPFAFLTILCFLLALGDFGDFSPYHLLHGLPGFSQTRVPSRWMIFVVFSILLGFSFMRSKQKAVLVLLCLSVIELFIIFGPFGNRGDDMVILEKPNFPASFSQYDNKMTHANIEQDPKRSYYYATAHNMGQIYADDSIINTLNRVYGTKRCGENVDKSCDLVLSDNASVAFWSPNKIVLERISGGDILLNMNPYYAWLVNGEYVYWQYTRLDPNAPFIITDTAQTITLTYSPKLSYGWLQYKLDR